MEQLKRKEVKRSKVVHQIELCPESSKEKKLAKELEEYTFYTLSKLSTMEVDATDTRELSA